MAQDVPLVGRASELADIAARFDDPDPPAIVLAGPPGVGKTRLAAEATRIATDLGYTTAHVMATKAAASIPLGAFAPLLPETDIAAGGLLGLLRAVAESILGQSGPGGRLLLVVDDAHLLDEASATLVHQLAAAGSSALVATLRTPAPAPDPITALWKDGLADRFDIGPLTELEVAEFAAGVLGGPVAGATVRRLWEFSGGNALYLRELLRGSAGSGVMTNRDGIWILSKPPAAPERLIELLGTRLADLPETVTDVVDYLAVAGSLGSDLLERLTSPAATEAAEQRGLIQVTADNRRSVVRLSHPLYGEARRQHMPNSRLRRLQRELADTMRTTGAMRREDLLQLASWQLGAGTAGDPELLTRAAKRARAMFDLDLAARLARAALEAGGGADAGLVLAVTLFGTGKHEEADRLLSDLASQCANDTERAAIANARGYNRSVLMGDPAGAIAVIDQAVGEISDPLAQLGLTCRAANLTLFSGDPAAALALVEPALRCADDTVASRAAYVASYALALLGRTGEAIATAEAGMARHRTAAEPTQLPEVQLIGAAFGQLGRGELATAEQTATRGYQACLDVGDKEGMATFLLITGCARVQQGMLAAAARAFREGVALNRELGDTGALRWCLGGLMLATGMAGEGAAAAAAAAELADLRADWMAICTPDLVERGRAWAAVAAGELSGARQILHEAAPAAREQGQLVPAAVLYYDIARLGEPAVAREPLRELATSIDGGFVALLADHAAAMAPPDAAGLDEVAQRLAGSGAWLFAAEAAAAAAAAYDADGNRRAASAAGRRADDYAATVGLTVPGRDDPAGIDQLTAREREIAALAATGTTSKDIAGRLFISQRTVDNHLQRIYLKLGLTGREQLRELLGTDS